MGTLENFSHQIFGHIPLGKFKAGVNFTFQLSVHLVPLPLQTQLFLLGSVIAVTAVVIVVVIIVIIVVIVVAIVSDLHVLQWNEDKGVIQGKAGRYAFCQKANFLRVQCLQHVLTVLGFGKD